MERILFTKFSNERSRRFSIRTDILQDSGEGRFVRKSACYPEGEAHIAAISDWYRMLNEGYQGTGITMNRCKVCKDAIEFEFLTGKTLEEILDSYLAGRRMDKLKDSISQIVSLIRSTAADKFHETEEFKEVFGETELEDEYFSQAVSNIDMVFSNIIAQEGWQVIDYEWTFSFPIPVNFIVFRMLHYYIYSDIKRLELKEAGLFEQFGIGKKELLEFEKMECHFQEYILGSHIPLRNLYQGITPGVVNMGEIAEENRRVRHKRMIQIYFDYGEGFSLKGSYDLAGREDGILETQIKLPAGVRYVRLDPCIDYCEVRIKELSGSPYHANGAQISKDWWIFDTEDPQIIISVEDRKQDYLQVCLVCRALSKEMAEFLIKGEGEYNLQELTVRLNQAESRLGEIQGTKVWKTYRKYRNIVEKGTDDVENQKQKHKNPLAKVKNVADSLIYHVDHVELFWDRLMVQGWLVNTDKEESISCRDMKGNPLEIQMDRFPREDVNKIYQLDPKEKTGFHISFPRTGSKVIRMVFRNSLTVKTYSLNMLKYNIKAFLNREVLKNMPQDYNSWMRRRLPAKAELENQRNTKFGYNPVFSVVIPLYNTPLNYLEEIIASVLNQTYSQVQLCLADGSTNDSVEQFIQENYGDHSKIVYKRLSENRGISENTNEGLRLATGDFIMLSDHDDIVMPNALYEMVKALNEDSEIDVIYTDEDKVDMDGKIYFDPHFKPDYNLDLLRSNNYICHIFVVKKTIVDKIGEFCTKYDGAQDYDFILRCCEQAKKVYHVPKVLYHWRSHPNSTAGNPESKMYAYESGRAAVAAHYDRIGLKAEVSMTEYFGRYRTKFTVMGEPLISIIIPNKDHIEDLKRCIASIYEKSVYRNFEIIIVENNSVKKETFRYYHTLKTEHANLKLIKWEQEFNYSAINNFAAKFAKGSYLLFLNNDTEVITPDWMEEMLGCCQREDVGAVGAKLMYEDDTVQHAGIVLGLGGAAGHIFYGIGREVFTYVGRTNSTQDISAVTAACMMTKKEVFDSVGGFDEELKVAFNDVDYCLRVQEKRKLVVYNAYAELYHYESKSRGSDKDAVNKKRFQDETRRFMKKWETVFEKGDPYYNPNLTLDRPDCTLRQ